MNPRPASPIPPEPDNPPLTADLPGFRPLPQPEPREDPLPEGTVLTEGPPAPPPPMDLGGRPRLPTTAGSTRASSPEEDEQPLPPPPPPKRSSAESREIVRDGLDVVFTLLAGLALRARLRTKPPKELMPSRSERKAVTEGGSRLAARHVDLDMGSDVIDVAEMGIGVAHWGARALVFQEPDNDNQEDNGGHRTD